MQQNDLMDTKKLRRQSSFVVPLACCIAAASLASLGCCAPSGTNQHDASLQAESGLDARAGSGQEQLVGGGGQLARLKREAGNGNGNGNGSATGSANGNGNGNGNNKKNKKSNKQLVVECLAAHNKYRRNHNVPDLEWDDKLATFAQKRSNHIAESDGAEFGHPPGLQFGENLFWHSDANVSCDYMVRGWYDEIELYNFEKPVFSPEVGHFTQVIWRDTQRVGCAVSKSAGKRGGIYLTCNYDPPGNFIGEFTENVPKRKLPPAPSTTQPPTTRPPIGTTTLQPVTTSTRKPIASTTSLQPDLPSTSSTAKPNQEAQTTKPKNKKKKNKNKNKKKNKKNKKRKNKKNKPSTTTTSTTSTTEAPNGRP